MKRVKLEDICSNASSNISQKDIETIEGDYPIYGASGFIKNINFYKFDKESIAIVKDGSGIGRTMILPKKSSVIGTMQYIIPNENVDIKYLYYAIKSLDLTKYKTGVAIPHIYFKDYKKEEIWLPDINEQKRVAKILDIIQNIIELRKKQIQELEEVAKAKFVEMFDSCKNVDFIGNRMEISRGASPRPISKFITENSEGINWIKISDTSLNSKYIESTKEKITIEGAKRSKFVKYGDFILSNSMSFGRPYILKINGCVHDGWLIMSKFEDSFDPLFLYYAIRDNEVQKQFLAKVNGVTVKNLNSKLVKETCIKVPEINKQKQYSDIVKLIDKQKFEIERRLNETTNLQSSLMAQYFGG